MLELNLPADGRPSLAACASSDACTQLGERRQGSREGGGAQAEWAAAGYAQRHELAGRKRLRREGGGARCCIAHLTSDSLPTALRLVPACLQNVLRASQRASSGEQQGSAESARSQPAVVAGRCSARGLAQVMHGTALYCIVQHCTAGLWPLLTENAQLLLTQTGSSQCSVVGSAQQGVSGSHQCDG